jgi:hypothetical protein
VKDWRRIVHILFAYWATLRAVGSIFGVHNLYQYNVVTQIVLFTINFEENSHCLNQSNKGTAGEED